MKNQIVHTLILVLFIGVLGRDYRTITCIGIQNLLPTVRSGAIECESSTESVCSQWQNMNRSKNTLTRNSAMGKDFNDKRLEILFLGIERRFGFPTFAYGAVRWISNYLAALVRQLGKSNWKRSSQIGPCDQTSTTSTLLSVWNTCAVDLAAVDDGCVGLCYYLRCTKVSACA